MFETCLLLLQTCTYIVVVSAGLYRARLYIQIGAYRAMLVCLLYISKGARLQLKPTIRVV